MNRLAVSALLVSCLSFGALGCSTTASVPTRSPAVAFGAGASDIQACTADGTQVLATHVVPKAGVAVALDPGTLQILAGETPPVETASSGSRGPAQTELPDHRRLVAWTEGSIETGMRVRASTLSPDGSADASLDLRVEGSAVGQPAVAVTHAGNGVIAFIESNDDGFQLVVTHVTCATP